MRASYKNAIAWIADNDETGEMDIEVISTLISVVLVADVWGKSAQKVAEDVIRLRKED